MAVWYELVPLQEMHDVVADSNTRLSQAARPWSAVRGNGAALVATAARLHWEIHDATHIKTDTGRVLSLIHDPPIVVLRECYEAVRRWRWKRIEAAFPDLVLHPSLTGYGAAMRSIWRLIANSGPRPPDGAECTGVRSARYLLGDRGLSSDSTERKCRGLRMISANSV